MSNYPYIQYIPQPRPPTQMSRRPGSDAAAELFASDDAMRWAECLDRYGEAVSLKAGVAPKTTTSGLVALDAWFINELPAINSTVNYYSSDSWSCRNDYTCIKDVCTSNCLTGSTSAAAAAKAGPLTSLLALFVLVKAICFA